MEQRKILKRKPIIFISTAIVLTLVLAFTAIALHFRRSDIEVNLRTVNLSSGLENLAFSDMFDNYDVSTEGDVTTLAAEQSVGAYRFSAIDNVSYEEAEMLAQTTRIFYDISYDVYTNIITLTVTLQFADGTVAMDTVYGVGFLDDNGEIDAVMNFHGEGMLLSEMRESVIDNVFLRALRNIAIAVAVAAVAVAVVALVVVVTVGAAAPAVVAVGVGIAGGVGVATATTAMSIAAVSGVVALIASGVAISAELINNRAGRTIARERVINGRRTTELDWTQAQSQTLLRDIVRENSRRPAREIYFRVTQYGNLGRGNVPRWVNPNPYALVVMAANMRSLGWSSVTVVESDAINVLAHGFPNFSRRRDIVGLPHWHPTHPNGSNFGVNDLTVHSWFIGW